jgi:hypothetical protein
MTDPTVKPPRSVAQMLFAYLAIGAGVMAFLQAGLRGRSAGWEELMLYAGPAVFCALVAIAIRRNALGYTALVFGALGIVGLVLGA